MKIKYILLILSLVVVPVIYLPQDTYAITCGSRGTESRCKNVIEPDGTKCVWGWGKSEIQSGGICEEECWRADEIILDITAKLTLIKEVKKDSGGTTASPTDWFLYANGPTSLFGKTGDDSVTKVSVPAGTYYLSEVVVPGGPTGYAPSPYSCSFNEGAAIIGNSINLRACERAVCTITNDDIPAYLTLKKIVKNNDNGTSLASGWTLYADGPTSIYGKTSDTSIPNPLITNKPVSPGTYKLSEIGPLDYHTSGFSCSINGGAAVAGNSVTLKLGQHATCTITNDDNASIGFLRIKSILPTIRSAAKDFLLTVNGSNFLAALSGIPNSGSRIYFDGKPMPTSYISDTQLSADIPASYIEKSDLYEVKVVNPAPNAAVSETKTIQVNPPNVSSQAESKKRFNLWEFILDLLVI